MKYRTLGKTGLRVSVVGLGTWQFGGEWGHDYTQAEADAIIDAAAESGMNLIDTAECYGAHLSEQLIGNRLGRDREHWIVATKFGHHFQAFMDREQQWSASQVSQQLEDSLKALGTDYIDIYQFHSGDDEAFDNDDLWSMLRRHVEAGRIRHLGISISAKGDLLHQVRRATDVGASVIQLVYNRLERGPEDTILPECMHQDLGVLARVPLASGYLSGKYHPGAAFAASDVRSTHDAEQVRAKLEQVAEIGKIEVPEEVPMARWALAWCLQHDAVTTVIPGCKNVDQVRQNAAAADLDLVSPEHPQSTEA